LSRKNSLCFYESPLRVEDDMAGGPVLPDSGAPRGGSHQTQQLGAVRDTPSLLIQHPQHRTGGAASSISTTVLRASTWRWLRGSGLSYPPRRLWVVPIPCWVLVLPTAAVLGIRLFYRNVQRFRGGLVFKAHGLLYSTLGLGVIQERKVPG